MNEAFHTAYNMKMLLAGILATGLHPHHISAIKELLGDPTQEELERMIMTGIPIEKSTSYSKEVK